MTHVIAILGTAAACIVWGWLRLGASRETCGSCETPCVPGEGARRNRSRAPQR